MSSPPPRPAAAVGATTRSARGSAKVRFPPKAVIRRGRLVQGCAGQDSNGQPDRHERAWIPVALVTAALVTWNLSSSFDHSLTRRGRRPRSRNRTRRRRITAQGGEGVVDPGVPHSPQHRGGRRDAHPRCLGGCSRRVVTTESGSASTLERGADYDRRRSRRTPNPRVCCG